jgi:hypothetical protein
LRARNRRYQRDERIPGLIPGIPARARNRGCHFSKSGPAPADGAFRANNAA